jgi:hypothetical protein
MHKKRFAVMLTFNGLLVGASQALAEGDAIVGKVGAQDWIDRLPVVMVATAFVIAVDSIFVVPALRNLRARRHSARGK